MKFPVEMSAVFIAPPRKSTPYHARVERAVGEGRSPLVNIVKQVVRDF